MQNNNKRKNESKAIRLTLIATSLTLGIIIFKILVPKDSNESIWMILIGLSCILSIYYLLRISFWIFANCVFEEKSNIIKNQNQSCDNWLKNYVPPFLKNPKLIASNPNDYNLYFSEGKYILTLKYPDNTFGHFEITQKEAQKVHEVSKDIRTDYRRYQSREIIVAPVAFAF